MVRVMCQKAVGQYLDREVCVTTSSNLFREVSPGVLAHASVFFWVATERHLMDFRSHLRDLVAGAPLVLFVAGSQADKAFDYLLKCLAAEAPVPQIMTRSREGTLPECLEELLQGTWPSEDRFDDWTTYLIAAEDVDVDLVRKATIDALGAHQG
jgi:hypothetical protein